MILLSWSIIVFFLFVFILGVKGSDNGLQLFVTILLCGLPIAQAILVLLGR